MKSTADHDSNGEGIEYKRTAILGSWQSLLSDFDSRWYHQFREFIDRKENSHRQMFVGSDLRIVIALKVHSWLIPAMRQPA
jgi:hypothetical protein